jgi:hypothetical protein
MNTRSRPRSYASVVAAPADPAALLLDADSATLAMWAFYRDHKQHLRADIRLYRDAILADLMSGASTEEAFAPYVKPAVPIRAQRRAA